MDHQMDEVTRVGDEHLFHCPTDGCGRQVAFNRTDLTITVLTIGDVFARHTGSTAPDVLSMAITK